MTSSRWRWVRTELLTFNYLIMGFFPAIGLILAYTVQHAVNDWAVSHARWQIRTFWYGIVLGLIGFSVTYASMPLGTLIMTIGYVTVILRLALGVPYAFLSRPMPGRRRFGAIFGSRACETAL